jgi:MFS family permease
MSRRLYEYFAMMFFGIMFQGFFAYVYKVIGLKEGLDDSFLAFSGSFGAFVSAVSRIGFGWLYDQIGFKKIFLGLMAVNIVNAILCYHARKNEWSFFVSI